MTLKSVQTLLDVLHFADSHTAIVVPELGIRMWDPLESTCRHASLSIL